MTTEETLMAMLDLTCGDFGRYREAYREGNHIVVEARIGGSNRDDYEGIFEALASHPLYDGYDYDEGDSTFVYFHFREPVAA